MLSQEQKREGFVEIVRNVAGTKNIEDLRKKLRVTANAALTEFINDYDNKDLLNPKVYIHHAKNRFVRQAKALL